MISAFGVEHTISKAFRKLSPKLLKADQMSQKHPGTMDRRLRENYAQWRGKGDKEGARAMVIAAGNRSKRKGRKLP